MSTSSIASFDLLESSVIGQRHSRRSWGSWLDGLGHTKWIGCANGYWTELERMQTGLRRLRRQRAVSSSLLMCLLGRRSELEALAPDCLLNAFGLPFGIVPDGIQHSKYLRPRLNV